MCFLQVTHCHDTFGGKEGLGWGESPVYFPVNLLLPTLESHGLRQTVLGFLGWLPEGGGSGPFCPAFVLEKQS